MAAEKAAMEKNHQIRRKGRPLSEAESGAAVDVLSEAQCLAERISGGEGLTSSQSRRSITLSYAISGRGARYSVSGKVGDEKGSWSKELGSKMNRQ